MMTLEMPLDLDALAALDAELAMTDPVPEDAPEVPDAVEPAE